jgi:hypothetical protein
VGETFTGLHVVKGSLSGLSRLRLLPYGPQLHVFPTAGLQGGRRLTHDLDNPSRPPTSVNPARMWAGLSCTTQPCTGTDGIIAAPPGLREGLTSACREGIPARPSHLCSRDPVSEHLRQTNINKTHKAKQAKQRGPMCHMLMGCRGHKDKCVATNHQTRYTASCPMQNNTAQTTAGQQLPTKGNKTHQPTMTPYPITKSVGDAAWSGKYRKTSLKAPRHL